MKTFVASLTSGAFLLLSATGPVFATGQPGASAGVTCGSPGATSTPGNSASAPGSAFNPDGMAGTVYAGNPGTASLNSNNPTAVSQYDIACKNVTQAP